MSEHSILAPSSLARTVQCAASVKLEALFPETEDGVEAAEGTAVHWAASEQLHGVLLDPGVRAPNGVVLTTEMLEAADMWLDHVTATVAMCGLKPGDGKIEQRVAIPRIHPLMWGTPDFRATLPTKVRPTIYVADLKYGHRLVDVFENYQLLAYAVGAWQEMGSPPDFEIDVLLSIVQPRAPHPQGPVRTWRFRLDEARALINIASNQCHAALTDPAVTGRVIPARTGPECRDCRARHACTTLQQAAFNAVDESGKPQVFEPSPAALALEVRVLREAQDRLKARLSGLEAQAEAKLRAGQRIPGLALQAASNGRLVWKRPAEEVIALGGLMGVSVAKKPEAITPLQAIKAGLPEALVSQYAERTRGEMVLALDDGEEARRVFGGQ